jgi:class 3 adenylate cyclase
LIARLAAILAAAVIGYSRPMTADERGTHARLKALRQDFIEPKIAERIVKLMGDGALVESSRAWSTRSQSGVRLSSARETKEAKATWQDFSRKCGDLSGDCTEGTAY